MNCEFQKRRSKNKNEPFPYGPPTNPDLYNPNMTALRQYIWEKFHPKRQGIIPPRDRKKTPSGK